MNPRIVIVANVGDIETVGIVVEAVLRKWAKGRDGMEKLINRLVAKGKEIEEKFNEGR